MQEFEGFIDSNGHFAHWDDETHSESVKNRRLFQWLSDTRLRAEFYRVLGDNAKPLRFQSRAAADAPPVTPPVFRQDAFLLTARADVEAALTDTDHFSNAPYQALGSGTFMLGLDGPAHDAQRAFATTGGLALTPPQLVGLATLAFRAASTLPLKSDEFDLAELAEQAALRFVAFWFGFSPNDHVLLQEAMRAAYRALNFQILARHFVTDPLVLPAAGAVGAKLLARVGELLDDPGHAELKKNDAELRALLHDGDFTPVLRTLSQWMPPSPSAPPLSCTERAIVAIGLIAGTIGNVQSGVANAVAQFDRADVRGRATALASAEDGDAALGACVMEALRLDPPAAFLPRRTVAAWRDIPTGSNVILAMGAALRPRHRDGLVDHFDDTQDPGSKDRHSLIFGGPADRSHPHQCLGEHVAKPLIVQFVKHTLRLDDLEPMLDPHTGAPTGLKRLWGCVAQSYPMRYRREERLIQQPLNVIMRIKTPLSEHAEKLKLIIRYGAPRIEMRLDQSRHVHFAWFVFLDNDSKLALFTTYDGNFDAYIEHFAHEIGSLFDKLFEHIEDAPRQKVEDDPKGFVDTIRRYNARPAEGYFYSAYPTRSVASIKPVAHSTSERA